MLKFFSFEHDFFVTQRQKRIRLHELNEFICHADSTENTDKFRNTNLTNYTNLYVTQIAQKTQINLGTRISRITRIYMSHR